MKDLLCFVGVMLLAAALPESSQAQHVTPDKETETRREHKAASSRGRGYATHLKNSLGVNVRTVRRVRVWLAYEKETIEARGVEVECANIRIQRFRFRTEREAERAWLGLEAKLPKVMEVRGKQVLVLSGKRLRDTAFRRKALRATWRGLGSSPLPPRVALLRRWDEYYAMSSHVKRGMIYEVVIQLIKQMRGRVSTKGTVRWLSQDTVLLTNPSGTVLMIGHDDLTRWVCAESMAAMTRVIDELTDDSWEGQLRP